MTATTPSSAAASIRGATRVRAVDPGGGTRSRAEPTAVPRCPGEHSVRHLSCATMCPPAARLGHARRDLVAHCLLVEGADGLTLVDTGFGTGDVADPKPARPRLRRRCRRRAWTPPRPRSPQVRALGYRPDDVRDIVVTHLDLDHAGGLGDFPHARVHVHRAELGRGPPRSHADGEAPLLAGAVGARAGLGRAHAPAATTGSASRPSRRSGDDVADGAAARPHPRPLRRRRTTPRRRLAPARRRRLLLPRGDKERPRPVRRACGPSSARWPIGPDGAASPTRPGSVSCTPSTATRSRSSARTTPPSTTCSRLSPTDPPALHGSSRSATFFPGADEQR